MVMILMLTGMKEKVLMVMINNMDSNDDEDPINVPNLKKEKASQIGTFKEKIDKRGNLMKPIVVLCVSVTVWL
jgi:hypothetical protein